MCPTKPVLLRYQVLRISMPSLDLDSCMWARSTSPRDLDSKNMLPFVHRSVSTLVCNFNGAWWKTGELSGHHENRVRDYQELHLREMADLIMMFWKKLLQNLGLRHTSMERSLIRSNDKTWKWVIYYILKSMEDQHTKRWRSKCTAILICTTRPHVASPQTALLWWGKRVECVGMFFSWPSHWRHERIIAALLVNNRPLLDVACTLRSIWLGANVRSTRGHDVSLARPCACHPICRRIGASGPHVPQHPTLFPTVNSVKAKCIRDRLRQSGLRYRV
jgi:hypothetical protein